MNAEMKKSIGARIRKRREEAGYTREQLGELCALSPRFIANIEFGDSAVSVDTLMALCRILSCSADYMLFGKEESGGDPWEPVTDRITHLDAKYQPAVSSVIQAIIEIANKG